MIRFAQHSRITSISVQLYFAILESFTRLLVRAEVVRSPAAFPVGFVDIFWLSRMRAGAYDMNPHWQHSLFNYVGATVSQAVVLTELLLTCYMSFFTRHPLLHGEI
jgi:hypothetical protein